MDTGLDAALSDSLDGMEYLNLLQNSPAVKKVCGPKKTSDAPIPLFTNRSDTDIIYFETG